MLNCNEIRLTQHALITMGFRGQHQAFNPTLFIKYTSKNILYFLLKIEYSQNNHH
jgi:hypothetical protein